jgi:hypothetical protein
MIELDKIPMEERSVGLVYVRQADLRAQPQINKRAAQTKVPGINNYLDMNPLAPSGGTLHEKLNRFEEVKNGGGFSNSFSALAMGQISRATQRRYNWSTVGDVRRSVSDWILQGNAEEVSAMLQNLEMDLESSSVLRHEISEQRKACATHELSEQRKGRAKGRAKQAVLDPKEAGHPRRVRQLRQLRTGAHGCWFLGRAYRARGPGSDHQAERLPLDPSSDGPDWLPLDGAMHQPQRAGERGHPPGTLQRPLQPAHLAR